MNTIQLAPEGTRDKDIDVFGKSGKRKTTAAHYSTAHQKETLAKVAAACARLQTSTPDSRAALDVRTRELRRREDAATAPRFLHLLIARCRDMHVAHHTHYIQCPESRGRARHPSVRRYSCTVNSPRKARRHCACRKSAACAKIELAGVAIGMPALEVWYASSRSMQSVSQIEALHGEQRVRGWVWLGRGE